MDRKKLPGQGPKGETHQKDQPSPVSETSSSFGITIATMLAALAITVGLGLRATSAANSTAALPPNSVFLDPTSFAVIGSDGPFLNQTDLFNPTGTKAPFFQIFDKSFIDILGSSPSIRAIAENDSFAFAHEAPIWVPSTDDVFFASNDGGALGFSDLNHNNQVSKISLKDVKANNLVNYTKIPLSDTIQMTNGGTPFRNNLLLVNSGRGNLPPNIVLVNPNAPFNSTVLLDNFLGRQFNSLNDVKIHPKSKAIFFTDPTYGFLNQFRPAPDLPSQVYRLDPDTGVLRVIADGFDKPNGIAFSPDGNTAYVTDTGFNSGVFGLDQTRPSTIYAFDVDATSQAFKNRRVLAYVDNGVPDGIEVDTKGNVYSGTGDGVTVWNSEGTLLGKFFLGMTSANLVFAGSGRLVILAETKIFLANIAATGENLHF